MASKKIRIKLADVIVDVDFKNEGIAELCAAYASDESGAADISVCVSDDEIDGELECSPQNHSREYCENVCIYRAIAESLPYLDRAVFHGAAVSVGGKGVIFAAPSGVGKSTHVRLWRECFGDAVTVINGDKPIIGAVDREIRVYGSPWSGKEGWNSNSSAPLEAVCLIRRGEKNRIFEIDPEEYFDAIVKQIYIPRDGDALLKTLDVLEAVSQRVRFYLLECNATEAAARLSFNTLFK